MTTYKRDFGDENPEEDEVVEEKPAEEVKVAQPTDKKKPKFYKSPIREVNTTSKSPSRERVPKKKKK